MIVSTARHIVKKFLLENSFGHSVSRLDDGAGTRINWPESRIANVM